MRHHWKSTRAAGDTELIRDVTVLSSIAVYLYADTDNILRIGQCLQEKGGLMLRIQRLREDQGLSRSALARIALMHAATVGQIESCYIGRPYQSQLEKLAAALGFTGDAEELLEEVDINERP